MLACHHISAVDLQQGIARTMRPALSIPSSSFQFLCLPADPLRRVTVITEYLLDKLQGADLVLLGVLPRSVPGNASLAQPNLFSKATAALNAQLK